MTSVPQGRGLDGKLLRELGMGICVLSVLMTVFVSAAYKRFGGVTTPPNAAMSSIKNSLHQVSQESKPKVGRQEKVQPTAKDVQPTILTARRIDYSAPLEPTPPATPAAPVVSTFVPNPDTLDADDTQFTPVTDLPSSVLSVPADEPVVPADEPADMPASLETSQRPAVEINATPTPAERVARTETLRQETILPNDSFWKIAQRAYGEGSYFRALHAYHENKFAHPDKLPAGQKINIPEASELRQKFPKLCPSPNDLKPSTEVLASLRAASSRVTRSYTVQADETLFDIACNQLGQGSRYVELIVLNRDVLASETDDPAAGTQLILPNN